MSAAAATAAGRRAAERLMSDTCTIRRVAGETTNRSTGQVDRTYTTVYAGRCRIQQSREVNATDTTVGEAHLLEQTRILQLPVLASVGVRAGDEVTITACPLDPDLVDQVAVVRGEAGKTHATARRLTIEVSTS